MLISQVLLSSICNSQSFLNDCSRFISRYSLWLFMKKISFLNFVNSLNIVESHKWLCDKSNSTRFIKGSNVSTCSSPRKLFERFKNYRFVHWYKVSREINQFELRSKSLISGNNLWISPRKAILFWLTSRPYKSGGN